MQKIIDLHTHSSESDGSLSPAEVVYAAKKAGLCAVALTDHDTISGVEKAIIAAESVDIELIPGIEISTEYCLPDTKENKRIHIIGLYINSKDAILNKRIEDLRAERIRRNKAIVDSLQKEGIPITIKDLVGENDDRIITRVNIAQFLYEHEYVETFNEAFHKYLDEGCPCYVKSSKMTPMEAVGLIKQANGIAVLAHPMIYRMSEKQLRRLVNVLKETGLDGIEAYYSTYTYEDQEVVMNIAKEKRLLISGGSDFHGNAKSDICIGTGTGNLSVPYEVLERMKVVLNIKNKLC